MVSLPASFFGSDGTKKRFLVGTHRCVAPQVTLDRARKVARYCGITRLASVTGLDSIGIPVAAAIRPNSRSLSVSHGKSACLSGAKASAIMEAIEGYHAEHIELPILFSSYAGLVRERKRVVEPLPLRATGTCRFSHHLRTLWVEGVDLLQGGRSTWVPLETVHLNYTLPPIPGHGCFAASSNGLASGNGMVEAIVHGLCEVVERDAVAAWFRQGGHRNDVRRIDLSSIDDEVCVDLLRKLDEAEVDAAIWDITTRLDIPSFLAMIVDRHVNEMRPMYAAAGAGCHVSRGVALSRALTEAAQSRLTTIAGARDDILWEDYLRFTNIAAIRESQQIACRVASRSFLSGSECAGTTILEDLELIVSRLDSHGYSSAIVVDLRKKALGVPVVRVVVPGLEENFEFRM